VVVVSVQDHGPVIAPDQQRLVFEKFGRVNAGGRSKPGAGATFTFRAPAR
jgi:signal transduction histidine kinase